MLSTSRDTDVLRGMEFSITSQMEYEVLFIGKMERGPAQTSRNCLPKTRSIKPSQAENLRKEVRHLPTSFC
jgi:hypothetical protein